MEKIGYIPYLTLEEGLEREYNVLNVCWELNSSRGFIFRKPKGLDPELARRLGYLGRDFGQVVEKLYQYYLPVFEDQDFFDDLVDKLLCRETFLESEDHFDTSRHLDEFKTADYDGVYERYTQIKPDGRVIKPGAHVKIRKSSFLFFKVNLFHEYAHALHFKYCGQDTAAHPYLMYDPTVTEVLAISAERAFDKHSYLKEPHKTAEQLLRKLEKLPEYARLPFHQRWKFLLNFCSKVQLENYLQNLEYKR